MENKISNQIESGSHEQTGLNRQAKRYVVQDHDADYGIWDIDERKFIGQPITMLRDANIVCAWYNDLKESEAENV